MNCNSEFTGVIATFRMQGNIDAGDRALISEITSEALRRNPMACVFDLQEIGSVNGDGARLLLNAEAELSRQQIAVSIARACPDVTDALAAERKAMCATNSSNVIPYPSGSSRS